MLALVSDIHGNLAALEAVLARIDELGIRSVYCLGDTAGYYPDVDACCAALRDRDVRSVRGNHDHYLVTGTRSGRSRYADLCMDQQQGRVADHTVRWLAELPLRDRVAGISVVHGGWRDPLEEYLLDLREDYFAPLDGDLFASGHTHRAVVWQAAGATYCNPGSVGQPRDGDPRASFAVFDGAGFAIERVVYDVERTRAATAAAGLPEVIAANLARGLTIGAT